MRRDLCSMKAVLRLYCCTALLLLRLDAGCALRKRWRRSWNLDDDANWSGGSVACPGQRLLLPQRLDYATYLSSPLRAEGLSLAQSGEIVFGEGGQLEIGGGWQRPSQCGAQPAVVTWTHTGRDEWWDPAAWSVPQELEANESAIPDLSRVPCTTDTAVLRAYPKYLSPIHFTPPTVRVQSVDVAGQRLTTSGVLDYAERNVSGQLTGIIQGESLLYVEQDTLCTGDRDCVCAGAGQAALLQQAVCRHRWSRCPVPQCDNPADMTDFCCPQCGVDFKLPSSFSGDARRLEGLLSSLDTSPAARGVARYVGLMSDRRYHVYVVPRDEKGDYAAVADMVARLLGKASSESLEVNAAGLSAYKKIEAGRSIKSGLISGFVIIVLLALLIYFVHKKGYTRTLLRSESPVNFQFRRMSMVAIRRLSRIPLHADVLSSRRPSDAQSSRTSDSGPPMPSYSVQTGGLRFMNPVFSKSTASLAAMPIDPEGGMSDGQEEPSPTADEVENPMYGAFMHMTSAEKQAYDESNLDSAQAPLKPPRLDEKSQGAIRFSQLGTIDEDAQSTEDDANEILTDNAESTELTRLPETSAHRLIETGDEPASTVESEVIDAKSKGNSGKESTPGNSNEDTKITIEVHQSQDKELQMAESVAAIEIPELPTVEQLKNMKDDDGTTGINFEFEDDE